MSVVSEISLHLRWWHLADLLGSTTVNHLGKGASLARFFWQFYVITLQPKHPSHLIVTSPPDPRLLRATLQTSYHRILRGLRVRGDDPNAPPLIFGGMLEEGAYLLARGDHPVSGSQQGAYGHSPSNWPSRTTADLASSTVTPSPSVFLATARGSSPTAPP